MSQSRSSLPILKWVKQYKKHFSLGLLFVALTNLLDMVGPYAIGRVIDLLGTEDQSIWTWLGVIFLAALGTAFFRYYWRIHFGRFHMSVAHGLRVQVFNKLMDLGLDYHSTNTTGEKMTHLTQDVENVRMGVGPGVLILVDGLIYTVIITPILFYLNPSWAWKCLIALPLMPIVISKIESLVNQLYRQQQDAEGEVTAFAQENVSGIKVIKSFQLESFRNKLFSTINQKAHDTGLKTEKIESLFGPVFEAFVTFGAVTLLVVGSKDVINGETSLGAFFAFYQYLRRMVWPMMALGLSFTMIEEAKSSYTRLDEVLKRKNWLPDGELKPKVIDTISLKDLNFKYPGDKGNVLEGIRFDLQKGQSMSIVGPVGSGKSSLLKILGGLIPTYDNSIEVDGKNWNELDLENKKSLLRLVPQDIFLFQKSIEENLYLNPYAAQWTHEVLKQVQLFDEITNMKDSFKTQLSENGGGLSGGQKQRLALARGLVTNPQWLLLDDVLSAVDKETETLIMEQLKKLHSRGAQHFIFSSHRLQSLNWVDQIIVLKDGSIEAKGSHEYLLEHSPTYRDLYNKPEENKKPLPELDGGL